MNNTKSGSNIHQSSMFENSVKECFCEKEQLEYTSKMEELSVKNIENDIACRKKQEERENRREEREVIRERLEEARRNINVLLMMEEKGNHGYRNEIEKNINILKEVNNIGSFEYKASNNETVDVIDSFHLSENDLQKSMCRTNIMEVVRQAKKNGWVMKISDDGVTVYKNGKKINGSKSKHFVEIGQVPSAPSHLMKPTQKKSSIKKNVIKPKTVKRK